MSDVDVQQSRRRVTVEMVGNVITQPFNSIAEMLAEQGDIVVEHLPFGQVEQTLAQVPSADFLVVHLDHRCFFDVAPDAEAVAQANSLTQQIRTWLGRGLGNIILNTPAFVPQSSVESDLHSQIESLSAVNAALFKLAGESERVSVIDVAGTVAELGYRNALRERNRHLMQAPYSPAAATAIAERYARSIRATLVPRRKVIVVDADNTLWGGVVGEDGVDGIVIDREYPGIVHFLFQQELRRLRSLGVLIAAVTKNNEADFVEAFQRRTMPLKLDDLVTYRSNWEAKSDNIRAIAEQLNLGTDAFIFIDDNPFEIEEVRARLPGVECILFTPSKPEEALAMFAGLTSLSARSLTAEDQQKSEQYRAEAQRSAVRDSTTSLPDYLASLEIEVIASCNNPAHLRRVAQLTNKTNQFNLTCRRYTEAEIEAVMTNGAVYDFRLIDRFGDMGIIAVAIVQDGRLESFLMSCRALGRKVETAILRYVSLHHPDIRAEYRPGPKNAMVAQFYDENGFEMIVEEDGGTKQYRILEGPTDVEQYSVVAA